MTGFALTLCPMLARVEGRSMLPALHPQDWLLAWRTARPVVGDVVLARVEGLLVVKRVAALREGRALLAGSAEPFLEVAASQVLARVVLVLRLRPLRLLRASRLPRAASGASSEVTGRIFHGVRSVE